MATAGPVHRVQSGVEVYGYPQGHIGHMTTDEQKALDNFKALLTEKGLYKPRESSDEYGTHDDATFLYVQIYPPIPSLSVDHASRFLRARRFQVQDAFKQFKDTEEWRNANELDQLYETIDLEHYDETRKLVRHLRLSPIVRVCALTGFLTTVSPMDRSSRSPWHSNLCLRGEASKLKDYVCVRKVVNPNPFEGKDGWKDPSETP